MNHSTPRAVRTVLKRFIPAPCRYSLRDKLEHARRRPGDLWFHLQGKTLTKRLIIVVGSGHRVGSTWLYWILRDIARCQLGINHVPTRFREFGTLVLTPETCQLLCQLRGHKIFKSHSLPPSSKDLAACAYFISIYRDPRDILVSASFYRAYLDKSLGGLGATFRQLSVPERIILLIKGAGRDLLPELEQWFDTPFAYKIKYEDMKQIPVEALGCIADYIGITISPKTLRKIIEKHSFEVKSGRKPGDGQEAKPMRKGIVGDWRNYFDQACIEAFETQRNGRWNRLLLEMGYETSLNWGQSQVQQKASSRKEARF